MPPWKFGATRYFGTMLNKMCLETCGNHFDSSIASGSDKPLFPGNACLPRTARDPVMTQTLRQPRTIRGTLAPVPRRKPRVDFAGARRPGTPPRARSRPGHVNGGCMECAIRGMRSGTRALEPSPSSSQPRRESPIAELPVPASRMRCSIGSEVVFSPSRFGLPVPW